MDYPNNLGFRPVAERFGCMILLLLLAVLFDTPGYAQDKKPNVLIIMSDDVGITNVGAYGEGLVGYQTPNIDRIAKEGVRFIDAYAEQSCTAGRSALITGIHPVRTGLIKVGLPGAKLGASRQRTRRWPNC